MELVIFRFNDWPTSLHVQLWCMTLTVNQLPIYNTTKDLSPFLRNKSFLRYIHASGRCHNQRKNSKTLPVVATRSNSFDIIYANDLIYTTISDCRGMKITSRDDHPQLLVILLLSPGHVPKLILQSSRPLRDILLTPAFAAHMPAPSILPHFSNFTIATTRASANASTKISRLLHFVCLFFLHGLRLFTSFLSQHILPKWLSHTTSIPDVFSTSRTIVA